MRVWRFVSDPTCDELTLYRSMRVIKQMFVWQTNNPNPELAPNRIIYLRQQELEQSLAFL